MVPLVRAIYYIHSIYHMIENYRMHCFTCPWPRVPNKTHPRFALLSIQRADPSAEFPATHLCQRMSVVPSEQDYPSTSRLWREAQESLNRGLRRRPMRRPPLVVFFLAPVGAAKSLTSTCEPICQNKYILLDEYGIIIHICVSNTYRKAVCFKDYYITYILHAVQEKYYFYPARLRGKNKYVVPRVLTHF